MAELIEAVEHWRVVDEGAPDMTHGDRKASFTRNRAGAKGQRALCKPSARQRRAKTDEGIGRL
jgi:hypothetical protein